MSSENHKTSPIIFSTGTKTKN